MTPPRVTDDRDSRQTPPTGLTTADAVFLAASLVVGGIVAVGYLLTHPYPAYGAGLYLEVAQQIIANNYRLPAQIPHYTAHGIPFAYPPFVFYASAVVLDFTSVDPVALSRFVPPVVSVLYLVPYYFVARNLLNARKEAGLATVLLATAPPTLQWHLSAGGLVRATAFLIALTGLYVGLVLFRSRNRWAVVPATLLFGLVVLTHPVYTVFFGLSYVLFFLAFDRSVRGLLSGAVVAAGGLALASPWWLQVVWTHGLSVFTAAAGTHSGLFGGVHRLVDQFVYPLGSGPPVPLFFVLSFAGLFYFLGRRQYLLPVWLVTTAFVIGKERFQFVAGSMMAAVFLFAIAKRVGRRFSSASDRRAVARGVLAAAVVTAVSIGVLFGAGALPAAHNGSPSQPAFMDQSDETAMTWVEHNTDPSAEFIVLGDGAEWFPLLTDRTILVGPWGVEWTSPDRYSTQLSLFRNLSTCSSEACVTKELRAADLQPEYIYVPKNAYTVRGNSEYAAASFHRDLAESEQYRSVYENQGVVIYRVTPDVEERHRRSPPVLEG